MNLIYIVIVRNDYPQRCAYLCLQELQRSVRYQPPLLHAMLFPYPPLRAFACPLGYQQFSAKVGDKAAKANDRTLDKMCLSIFQVLCKKYNNLAEVDKLAAVAQKVENVKLVMQENVDMALQNCVKLENIERQAEELQQQAGVFKRNATDLKNKMWWKNMKMKLILAFIFLAILGIIIGVIAYMVQKNKTDKDSGSSTPSN